MPKTLDFTQAYPKDWEAKAISEHWVNWGMARRTRIEELKDLRNYLFATDTRSTSNNKLPWSNSTTTPKLTQIRDNLHANYMAALFPQDKFFSWIAADRNANNKEVRTKIENYVLSKVHQSDYKATISRLVLDWIDTGNAFCITEWEKDILVKENGLISPNYVGPRTRRISIYDIVFNPLSESFAKSPKIIKEIVTLGDIEVLVEQGEDWMKEAVGDMKRIRGTIHEQDSEIDKSDGYIADGFSSIQLYLDSGYVELLHFFGDIYNSETKTLERNRIITIADRARVIRNIEAPGFMGSNVVRHSGWRKRPDNLYAMGPLENLVGMQYRIDHLENMKADVFDQIAYPKMLIQGEVQEFGDDLGERIYLDTEGSVAYLTPDPTALNADMQIADLANKMEELAGAPRNAMGIRTPGEKTAFEVDTLASAANRIFDHKAGEFEREIIDTSLNDFLSLAVDNMEMVEDIRIQGEDGTSFFDQISPADISGNGTLKAVGARHFAERNRRVGNLTQLHQLKLQDPSMGVHISGKKMAQMLTEEIGEQGLFSEYAGIFEQQEAAGMAQEAQIAEEEAQEIGVEQAI